MSGKTIVAAWGVALGLAFAIVGISQGRANNPLSSSGYTPHLGDLMNTMQMRHLKLWFAGRSKNWLLASYEIDQMMDNFQDIALLYPGLPVADMATLAEPTKAINAAIIARDVGGFSQAFDDLTSACNACHQSIGRGYIVVQVPTASPFSNQAFPPK